MVQLIPLEVKRKHLSLLDLDMVTERLKILKARLRREVSQAEAEVLSYVINVIERGLHLDRLQVAIGDDEVDSIPPRVHGRVINKHWCRQHHILKGQIVFLLRVFHFRVSLFRITLIRVSLLRVFKMIRV